MRVQALLSEARLRYPDRGAYAGDEAVGDICRDDLYGVIYIAHTIDDRLVLKCDAYSHITT